MPEIGGPRVGRENVTKHMVLAPLETIQFFQMSDRSKSPKGMQTMHTCVCRLLATEHTTL